MTNHPNRSQRGELANPLPAEIISARQAAGLTQTEAAGLVCGSLRAWQQWEAGDRRMHPGLWRLFLRESGTANERAHKDCQKSEETA
jgi:DNA-binding transcriptional regulator YiaG